MNPLKPEMVKLQTDNSRRLTLRLLIKMMIWFAIAVALWVLFAPFSNTTSRKSITEAVMVDVSDMKPGEVKVVEWAGRPLIIAFRLTEWEATLSNASENYFRDPLGDSSVQPEFARNALRSSTANWFVAIGLGTGMGCALTYQPPSSVQFNGEDWSGGFVDACDASRFDLSGRVFTRQSATKNLSIPHWQLEQQKIVLMAQ